MKTAISVLYGIFFLGSLFSGSWYREALDSLRAGAKPANLKIGSWVQAAWMYGAPSWFFWGLASGALAFVAMGVRLSMAVTSAEAFLRAQQGAPRP